MAARALATAVAVAFAPTTSRSQSALMVGGRPPKDVEMELCDIGTVFAKLNEIKSNPDCHSQPAPPTWYPGRADTCNAACGIVFEPFWDQCGEMLTVAGMGGMDEMGIFCAFANSLHANVLSALQLTRSCQMTTAWRRSTRRAAAARSATSTPTNATSRRSRSPAAMRRDT